MKKYVIVVGILALGIGFVLGQAAKSPRFPYVSKEFNAPCDKTVFEWNCATKSFGMQTQPIKMERRFDLVGLLAHPDPDGLIVWANAKPREGVIIPPARDRNWNLVFDFATDEVIWIVQDRFGAGRGKKPFAGCQNLTIHFRVDDKPAAVRTADGIKVEK